MSFIMDFIFQDFGTAFDPTCKRPGYILSETLSPDLVPETLQIIWRSTNYHDARSFIRRNLNNSLPHKVKLSKDELDGWADIYLSYWKTAGEILAVQGQGGAPGGKVRETHQSRPRIQMQPLICDAAWFQAQYGHI